MSMRAFWLGAIPALVLLAVLGGVAGPLVAGISEPWKSIVLIGGAVAILLLAGWVTERILGRRRGE
jgi:hypothetical protein